MYDEDCSDFWYYWFRHFRNFTLLKKKESWRQRHSLLEAVHNKRYTSLHHHGAKKNFKDNHQNTSCDYVIHTYDIKGPVFLVTKFSSLFRISLLLVKIKCSYSCGKRLLKHVDINLLFCCYYLLWKTSTDLHLNYFGLFYLRLLSINFG